MTTFRSVPHNISGKLLIELNRNLSKCLLGDKKQLIKMHESHNFLIFDHTWWEVRRKEKELNLENHRATRQSRNLTSVWCYSESF